MNSGILNNQRRISMSYSQYLQVSLRVYRYIASYPNFGAQTCDTLQERRINHRAFAALAGDASAVRRGPGRPPSRQVQVIATDACATCRVVYDPTSNEDLLWLGCDSCNRSFSPSSRTVTLQMGVPLLPINCMVPPLVSALV